MPTAEPPLLTVNDVAALVGCSPRTVRRAIAAGRLRAVRPTGPTGRYKVRPDDYEAWIADSAVRPPAIDEPVANIRALDPRGKPKASRRALG